MHRHIAFASKLTRKFFCGHQTTLPKPKWNPKDLIKMIFLTGLVLFLFSYGAIEIAKWRFGELETLLWIGEHMTGVIVAGMLIQILVEMFFLYLYTHRKYGVVASDFGFRTTKIESTITLGALLFLLVAVGQNLFLEFVNTLPSILNMDVSFLNEKAGEDSSTLQFLLSNEIIPLWFLFLFAGVIAPITEELVFRGFLLPSVMEHMGYMWGVVITSAIFAIVHLVFDPITLLIMFLLGAMLSVLYVRTQSLWPGIVFHMINNIAGVTMALTGIEKIN